MVRLTIQVKYSRRALVTWAFAIAFLVTAGLVLVLTRPAHAGSSAQAVYMPQGGGRHVYLTDLNYFGDEALTACGAGYRMASLWEILDTSNWSYDYDHPDAHVKSDSGMGPPSYWYGWIRTGWESSNASTAGTGNCSTWTSRSNADHGTSVRLSRTWETAPGEIMTWDAFPFPCNVVGPVWCVSDINAVYLPLMLRNP